MKKKALKILLYVLCFAVAAALCYMAFGPALPSLWSALKSGSEDEIRAFLAENSTAKGFMYLFLLQFIQVVSIVLPGAPIELGGGMVYGFVASYIICHLSVVCAHTAVFIFARRVRTDFINSEKVQKAVEWLSSRDPFAAIILACMLPVVPNGIIPYAASLTQIKSWQFALSVYIGSIEQMFMMCIIGRRALSRDFLTMALVVIGDVIVIFLVYKFQDKINDFFKKITNGK